MTGEIRVDTDPVGAEVYLDDVLVGITPLDITSAETPKPYTYLLKLEGFEDYSGSFDLNDLETYQIVVNLVPVFPTDTSLIVNKLDELNNSIQELILQIQLQNKKREGQEYDRHNIITTAVLTPQPDNLGAYQYSNIHDILEENAPTLYLYNHGPGISYIISSQDGIHYTDETHLEEGQNKIYSDVYSIGVRSPVVGNSYHVSERYYIGQTAEKFSGTRFGDRRDRKGAVIFHDDIESPTAKALLLATGTATITRNNEFAWSGDFSYKCTIPALNVVDTAGPQYRFADIHHTKMGAQQRFYIDSASDDFQIIEMDIDIAIGGQRYFGSCAIDMSTGNVEILNPDFTTTRIRSGMFFSLNTWNILKLVVDPATGRYVRLIVNTEEFDLSEFYMFVTPAAFGRIIVDTFIYNNNALGGEFIVYFDEFILTEDELS